jgi:hypothetical protein
MTLQPMTVSQFGSKPNQVLLSGLRSADPYYQVRTETGTHKGTSPR